MLLSFYKCIITDNFKGCLNATINFTMREEITTLDNLLDCDIHNYPRHEA